MKHLFTILFLLMNLLVYTQNSSLKFDWVGNNVNSSTTMVSSCSPDLQVDLKTSIFHFKNTGSSFPTTAAGIQTNNGPNNQSSTYNIQITFSQPVSNVKLKIIDLDQDPITNTTSDQNSTYPEEVLINISPNITNTGNVFQIVGNEIHPLVENATGWLEWNSSNITSISIDVKRFNNRYGILLEELKFDCIKDQFDPPSNDEMCCQDILLELKNLRKELKEIQEILKSNRIKN